MWKSFVLLLCLSGYCLAGPVGTKRNMPIVQQRDDASSAASSMESLMESEPVAMAEPELPMISTLTLPSNATSIRADITDNFSCENKTYGYYADVDNDCQIFHVCLPVTYADGKENTFRWSFICPEETIFSQDSFTCMRPDDMTITCDESFQYYELNRNFGMVESNKDNTEPAAESEKNESNETVMEAETQPEPVVQMEAELEKEAPKPVKQTIKVQKPNRRKPAVSYSSSKKPNNSVPLRKMPQVQPVMPVMNDIQVAEDKNEAEKPVQEDEEDVKPVVQKFSRRPMPAVTNALKDKIESSKPESMTRTQFFNQNRKRPSMFNKKPLEQEAEPKPEMEPIQVQESQPEQTFFNMESDMPNNNAETQVADSEIQASENNEVFVNPEEIKEAEASMTEEEPIKVEEVQTVKMPIENVKIEEPQQVLEAFEEIPAFISEVLETQSGAEEEHKMEEQLPVMIADETQIVQESQNTEESQNVDESQNAVETEKAEETQNAEETQSAEESQNAEETQNVEETQHAEETQTAEETQNAEKSQIAEDSQKSEEGLETLEVSQTVEEQVAEESQKPDETPVAEETKSVEESQIVDEAPTSEEIQINDKIEEPQPVEEVQFVENVKPVEDTLFVEEPQPVEEVVAMEDVQTPEESQIAEETPIEIEAKPEQLEVFPASEELVKSQAVAEPAIFESSDEGLAFAPSQTIEEMEDERPADAPESMQATNEMSYPGPMVQQMMDDLEDNKHSIGGFKPVDPVMAHEAEQLIADFINTLRNNDFTNETPGMIRHQYNNEEPAKEQEQAQDNVSVVEEADKIENNDMTMEEAVEVSDKTEEQEESVKTNEEVKEETVPEISETQELAQEMEDAKEEPQTLSQEITAEEMEDVKKESDVLSQENNAEEIVDAKDEEQTVSEEKNVEAIDDVKEETQPEIMVEENTDNQESIALKSLEAQSSEKIDESQKMDEQQAESSNMMVMTNMPEEMYQIPVQVISAPEEEMTVVQQEPQAESETSSENKPVDMTASTEEKLEEAAPAVMMGGYKPLSIDDIVELVKERLDQMPKNEMETPMQLEQVLGDMQDEKVSEAEAEVEEEAKPAQSEEEIVMPIYQRTIQPVKVEAGAETDTQEKDLSIEQSEVATDVKEKSNRSYRSRSMLTPKLDPRKRRFLFKSDKNKSS